MFLDSNLKDEDFAQNDSKHSRDSNLPLIYS
jgi:hypothetical protein